MTGYPKWFSKKLITTIFLLLILTGVGLIPNTLDHRFGIPQNFSLQGSYRLFTTAAHVLISYCILLIVGCLMFIHVKLGLKKNKNVSSGIIILSSFMVLALSGIMLLYASDDLVVTASSLAHLIVGILVFIVYLVHLKLQKS